MKPTGGKPAEFDFARNIVLAAQIEAHSVVGPVDSPELHPQRVMLGGRGSPPVFQETPRVLIRQES